ncbi:MAG: phosphoribosyltransferase family protein [Candidatus Dependentiae bacterium]|nr:phosphoribosyltransferase family protein [Candidatus Dependentiae bacterium]
MQKIISILQKSLYYGAKQIGNILSPPQCAHCKLLLKEYAVFCTPCEQTITPVVSTTITLSSTYTMKIFAISGYKEPIKSLILAKSRSDRVASQQLGELIWKNIPLKHAEIDYLIPIPLHWTRYAYRGYNQAHEMARIIGRYKNKSVLPVLARKNRTLFQSTLTHAKRLDNVKDAFTIVGDGSQIRDKHILLVDDLMTTSATLQSAAKLLIKYKPASISAVVACRVV